MAERSGSSVSSSEDRLPWLEPVEDDVADYAVPRGRLAGGVVLALVAIAVIVGGLFWARTPRPEVASTDEIALIPAPPGNYKTKPADAGGMKVDGAGTAATVSQGADPDAKINMAGAPEAPVKSPAATKVAAAEPAKAPTPPAAPAKPAAKPTALASKAPAKPAATTVALPAATAKLSGPAIQLGAFSSQASADAAWKSLSGRYASLGGLSKNVVAAPKGSGTVYRLRAAGANAVDACVKMKAAGGSCVVVRD
jgi:cell division septation protein DedD